MSNKEKILLELYIPASSRYLEIRVPKHLKIARVKAMLLDYLRTRKESEYYPSDDAVLCDRESGRILNENDFVDGSGLREGSRVIII